MGKIKLSADLLKYHQKRNVHNKARIKINSERLIIIHNAKVFIENYAN